MKTKTLDTKGRRAMKRKTVVWVLEQRSPGQTNWQPVCLNGHDFLANEARNRNRHSCSGTRYRATKYVRARKSHALTRKEKR